MENFEEKTIRSFNAARADVDELKRSINEWVIFLDSSLRQVKIQLRNIERKISEIESRHEPGQF